MPRDSVEIPRISEPLLGWFLRYVRVYLRRNFHAVRLARGSRPQGLDGYALLVISNHPGWWDPLILLLIATELFAGRKHFGPIEAKALEKYKFFAKLGFFGIEPGTARGAAKFLRVGSELLSSSSNAVWVTAQGAFADVRQRPIELRPGAGHLVRRLQKVAVLPLALECTFWEERYPEALAAFGEPILIEDSATHSSDEWTAIFARAMEAAQDRLAADAMARRADRFEVLLGGRTGVGGVYDVWRSLRARLRGESFSRAHGTEKL